MKCFPHKICVAPMMDWTDRHCRHFLRLITRHALLYTEMVTADAVLRGDTERVLAHDKADGPVALQLGGSEPLTLASAAQVGEQFGYDEINLNIGCPSDRVQSGRFGACLMAEPERVAECIAAMRSAVAIPVTVKTRIGIDDSDGYRFLERFVTTVAQAGCELFIIHARKAILRGLSPKQNREIPPLDYDMVRQVKADFPGLSIILNGGIKSLDQARHWLKEFDGVMIGREAYSNPYLLAEIDNQVFGEHRLQPSRTEILAGYEQYVARQLAAGVPLNNMLRHVLGLFQGCPGARNWRRHLSENAKRPGQSERLLREAAEFVQPA